MDKKKNKYDVDIPKEVLDAFARYIIPEIRRFHEREEGQAFYREWLEKHGKPDIDLNIQMEVNR